MCFSIDLLAYFTASNYRTSLIVMEMLNSQLFVWVCAPLITSMHPKFATHFNYHLLLVKFFQLCVFLVKQWFNSYATMQYIKFAWNFSAHIKILEVNWKSWFCHKIAQTIDNARHSYLECFEHDNRQKNERQFAVVVNLEPQMQLFNHFLFQ